MTKILDRQNAILGDAIMRHQDTGYVEVFSDVSGVAITGVSGDIEFKDQHVTGYVRFSESGEVDIQTVNSRKSIVGLLNQIGRIFVSSNDTDARFLEQKLFATSGITVTTMDDGGDETMVISVNPNILADVIEQQIEHNKLFGVQGGVDDEHYHLTAQQLIDLVSGLPADNQHSHNASAILVDSANFDIISGADLQTVLDVIDEALKTRNTMLVNFDIAGGVRNGNTSLGIDNDTIFCQFKHDKVGTMGFSARVPENYIPGTALSLRIKWYSLAANTNDVVWRLSYKGLASGENVSVSPTNVDQTVAEPGVIGQLVETTFAISGSAFALGDIMGLVVKRIGDDVADTSNKDARVVEVSLDY